METINENEEKKTEESEEMVKVQPNPEHCYYLDGYLKANLDTVAKDIRKDYDAFINVTGREGFGKSTLAFQIAMYLDPTFCLDRVVFTDEQFIKAVEDAEQYQAIVFDETMGYLGSRGAMSKFNRSLIKVMSEMRFRNLIIILCIPSFFELDKYPAIHRSTGLVHVYKRGRFGSYDYAKKKNLYLFGKKSYSYAVSPTFIGCFVKYFPFDKEEYEKKKRQAMEEYKQTKTTEHRWKMQRNLLVKKILGEKWMRQRELGEVIGLSIHALSEIVNTPPKN